MIEELKEITRKAKEEEERHKYIMKRIGKEKEKSKDKKRIKRMMEIEKKVDRKIEKIINGFEKKAKKAASRGETELTIDKFFIYDRNHDNCYKKLSRCECIIHNLFVKKLRQYCEPRGLKIKEFWFEEKLPLCEGYDESTVYIYWE